MRELTAYIWRSGRVEVIDGDGFLTNTYDSSEEASFALSVKGYAKTTPESRKDSTSFVCLETWRKEE